MGNNKNFWEKNLLQWEARRYGIFSFLNPFSVPLRKRMGSCEEILLSLIPKISSDPIHIVEFGCGSGLLAEKIQSRIAHCKYTGYDISTEGVLRAEGRGLGPNFSFKTVDLADAIPPIPSDISLFLGLSDWLGRDENRSLLCAARSKFLIWSYTLKDDKEIQSASYSFYRKFLDKKGLDSLSWTADEVNELLDQCKLKRHQPDQKFSFGPGFLCCLTREDGY